MKQLHRRACNLCEAMCGLHVELDGERIVSIRGDDADPHSRGFICPKAVALKDLQEDPDRLRQPMRRTASGWQPVSWAEALAEAGARIAAIQAQHGDDALGIYWGNPPTHNHGLVLTMNPVFDALRTRNRYSAASIDQLPQYLVSRLMFGNQLRFPLPDLESTDFWLVLGANPLASNGSIGSGPDMRLRIEAIRARGGRVVVIDPRRTETAEVAGEHVSIKPGGDVWLLLGMAHVITAAQGETPEAVQRIARGLGGIRHLFAPCTPEAVAARAGVPAAQIRALADDFAAAKCAVAYGRLGVSQTTHGTLCHWLINLLNLLTGNLDRPGGAMFSRPAFDMHALVRLFAGGGRFGRWHSRVRGLPEFSDELPVATLADEMLTSGPGQIRALLLLAGNPVLSSPNGQRLDAAMGGLEFCVAIDYYLNESTRHAHLILPPVTVWERAHYEAAVASVQVRNVARYSSPALPRPADGHEEWQILVSLLAAVLRRRSVFGRLAAPVLSWLTARMTPDRLLDLALRLGPYGKWRHKAGLRGGLSGGLSVASLRAHDQTLDLGPLVPMLPAAVDHPDGLIDATPALFRAELLRLLGAESVAVPAVADELRLIGRRQLRTNNSWMHNYRRLVKGPLACTLLMHPDDAAERGLAGLPEVTMRSPKGTVRVALELSDSMRPGVVSLPHGWGHGRAGTQLKIANAYPGVSINDLTDESMVDQLSGNAAVNGVPVWVTAD